MRTQISLFLLLVLGIPGASQAFTPFDITDATPRSVRVHIDKNYLDPSLVGTNLQFAFTGTWSTSGGVGTVTVPAADAYAVFPASGAPGTPVLPGTWSDLEIDIDLSTGEILDMSQTGTINTQIGVSFANTPFEMHLNSSYWDFTADFVSPYWGYYVETGFSTQDLGGGPFPDWCAGFMAGDCSGYTAGPTPFGYQTATGRFNAIGPVAIDINPGGSPVYINSYGTYGDARLFEDGPPAVPLGPMAAIGLAAALGATGLAAARRRVSP